MRRLALLIALLCAWAPPVFALPRFAAHEGASCALCHTNPTGGGMRNPYGRNLFEKGKLGFVRENGRPVGVLNFDPQITEHLALGGDARLLALFIPSHGRQPEQTAFFPMQADLYLRADVARPVTFYHDQGALGSFETMTIARFGEGRGPDGSLAYAKAGKFVPPFGTKLDNHTAYIREPFGFPPTGKDGGIELGVYPGRVSIILAFTNGDLLESSNLDTDRGKMVTLRTDHAFEAGPLKFTIGGSESLNFRSIETDAGEKTSTDFKAGGFLYAGLGRLTFVGEADLGHECIEPGKKAGTSRENLRKLLCRRDLVPRRSLVTYEEIGFLPRRGIELLLTHEYQDPDIDVRPRPDPDTTDQDIRGLPVALHRYGVGVETFPLHFFELRLLYRMQAPSSGGPIVMDEKRTHEFLFMTHLFF